MQISHLGKLSDPGFYTDDLELPNLYSTEPIKLLRDMMTIRRAEELIAELVESNDVCGPCHLGIGQEAIAVGIAQHLTKNDKVFGTHRAHAHYLSLGGSVYQLLAEVMGKATGCSKGLGGSQHLYGGEFGFMGSLPIVGGTVPIAVGAALAAKLSEGNDSIAVCFFGDGASEEGVLHESLNIAAAHELPVLFVCENNFYSSHLDINLRQPSDRVSRFAEAHHMTNLVIDGNDIFAVSKASATLIAEMRKINKPAFLEVITYRWRGHVGPREDIDVGLRRKAEDLVAWKKRDPIRRLANALIAAKHLDEQAYELLRQELEQNIQADLAKAKMDPYPRPESLMHGVYAEVV